MTLDTLASFERTIALFVGESGSGKSAAIASFAEVGDLKVYDLDKRARGMLGLNWPPEFLKKIEIEQGIKTKDGFKDLDKAIELDLIQLQTGRSSLKTISFESLGTLQKILMYDSMSLRGALGDVKNASFKGKIRGSLSFPHPDDYNYVSAAMNQLVIRGFYELKCNVILSAWVVDQYGKPPQEAGKENEYAKDIVIGKKILATNALAAEMPGYFDEVYYFNKDETGRATEPLKFTVEFESKLAKTAHKQLKGLGKVDITNKSFYRVYKHLLSGASLTSEVGKL